MKDFSKYSGVFPAFYACYDDNGEISPERVRKLTEYHLKKGVKGVYVNGSSGECIYLSVEDRKKVLENVMEVAKGKLTVIAHVACNNTKDSVELAKHAESMGLTPLPQSHRFTSSCRTTPLPSTGTILARLLRIRTSLSTTSHNLPGRPSVPHCTNRCWTTSS